MSTSTERRPGRLGTRGRRLGCLWTGADGFSLVEAIAAAGLLSVVMLGFALGTDRAVRYNAYSRTVAAATTLAHDKIEELQSKVATDPALTAGTHNDAGNPLSATGTAGGIYTRTWVVTDNTPIAGIKTIEVTVTWSLYTTSHTIREVAVKT